MSRERTLLSPSIAWLYRILLLMFAFWLMKRAFSSEPAAAPSANKADLIPLADQASSVIICSLFKSLWLAQLPQVGAVVPEALADYSLPMDDLPVFSSAEEKTDLWERVKPRIIADAPSLTVQDKEEIREILSESIRLLIHQSRWMACSTAVFLQHQGEIRIIDLASFGEEPQNSSLIHFDAQETLDLIRQPQAAWSLARLLAFQMNNVRIQLSVNGEDDFNYFLADGKKCAALEIEQFSRHYIPPMKEKAEQRLAHLADLHQRRDTLTGQEQQEYQKIIRAFNHYYPYPVLIEYTQYGQWDGAVWFYRPGELFYPVLKKTGNESFFLPFNPETSVSDEVKVSSLIADYYAGMFDHLKIASLGDQYMQHQGKYPVIFMTLKDITDHNFTVAYEKISDLMAHLYEEHREVLDSSLLSEEQQSVYRRILRKEGNFAELSNALRQLVEYLGRYHQQKVWLLIDEYDSPIQSAYLHGYYDDMISLMRSMLGAALNTNPYLEKAVITGILRIAKESLFSGLNNLIVCTLLDTAYSEYFGFTESEVTDLFHRAGLDHDGDKIRSWYNGYRCGDTVIYNPWSIAWCIRQQGQLDLYWVNTSGNDLLKQLFAQGDEVLKDKLEQLLVGQPIEALINAGMVFSDLQRDQNAVWSLLLFSGYLKAIHAERSDGNVSVELTTPNYEVSLLYRDIVRSWLSQSLGEDNYQSLLKSLLRGDIEEFQQRLQDCLALAFSIFDITGKHPEKFYHGFVLGLMVSLSDTYQVQSNKESGYGRYDVMLIPNDRTQLGLVLEFKTVREPSMDLTQAAQQALQQIIERRYADQLRAQGLKNILQVGLAFYDKQVKVLADSNSH